MPYMKEKEIKKEKPVKKTRRKKKKTVKRNWKTLRFIRKNENSTTGIMS